MRTLLVISLCLGVAPGPPENYRDLQFYTVSAPAPGFRCTVGEAAEDGAGPSQRLVRVRPPFRD